MEDEKHSNTKQKTRERDDFFLTPHRPSGYLRTLTELSWRDVSNHSKPDDRVSRDKATFNFAFFEHLWGIGMKGVIT